MPDETFTVGAEGCASVRKRAGKDPELTKVMPISLYPRQKQWCKNCGRTVLDTSISGVIRYLIDKAMEQEAEEQ
jgi:hypothetical protein